MSERTLQRVVRRETHSPRTAAMVVAVLLVALVLLYLGVEIVLGLLAQPALLIAPADALGALGAAPTAQPSAAVIAAGVVAVLIGLVLVVLALTPGRLPRHVMDLGDHAVVVDNGVVAACLAQRLSDEAGIARDRITVGVAHRVVDVRVTPDAGLTVDAAQLRAIADEEMAGYHLTPAVKTVVKIGRPKEQELQR
ncbi:DNA/RNA endonuclease G [Microbacterium sp. P04]|uniref:DNA/RNA endonuclease G n=1 Tax=Microbacterium sp. P04 TaxID=3366947 RepID=UPI003745A80B